MSAVADLDNLISKLIELLNEAQSDETFDEKLDEPRKTFDLKELAALYEKHQLLVELVAHLGQAILDSLEHERNGAEFAPLPSGRVLELYESTGGYKWNHKRVKKLLAERIEEEFVDEKGNLRAPLSQVVREAFDVAGVQYWKTGALKNYDMDADDYRTRRPSKFRAKIHDD